MTRDRRGPRAIAAGALAVILAVALIACSDDADPRAEPSAGLPAPSAYAKFGTYSEEEIPFEAGTYSVAASAWSVADFVVTFPDGWTTQYGNLYAKPLGEESGIGFYAVVVEDIYNDACRADETRMEVGPSVEDLVTALRRQPGAETSKPTPATLGGHQGVRVDFRIPPGVDLGKCRLAADGVDGLQIWHSVPADKYFVLLPDWRYTAYILDVEGQRQVFLTWHHEMTQPSDRAELQEVLDSIRIEPTTQ